MLEVTTETNNFLLTLSTQSKTLMKMQRLDFYKRMMKLLKMKKYSKGKKKYRHSFKQSLLGKRI